MDTGLDDADVPTTDEDWRDEAASEEAEDDTAMLLLDMPMLLDNEELALFQHSPNIDWHPAPQKSAPVPQ